MYIIITWTAENEEEARQIAAKLVEKKWIACANIIPEVLSIYSWQDKIYEETECKVFFKTTEEHFDSIREYIIKHASYDVPEISQIAVSDANLDYAKWLERAVTSR